MAPAKIKLGLLALFLVGLLSTRADFLAAPDPTPQSQARVAFTARRHAAVLHPSAVRLPSRSRGTRPAAPGTQIEPLHLGILQG